MRECRTPFERSSVRCRAAARHPASVRSGKAMSEQHETVDWQRIGAALREPFDPRDVDFRVQGRANEATGRAQVVAYIDARAVQDRLDTVVGPGNWSFDWQPVVMDKGEVMVAKGVLTIHGVAKADAGSASNFEQSLGAVSHCFKRAAVHWGIGRYLYGIPQAWVQVEKGGRIPEPVLRELRGKLPRPKGQQARTQAQEEADPQAAESQPGDAPTSFAEIAQQRASADVQRDLAEQISRAGHKTVGAAEAWLEGVCGRHIGAAALKSGSSSITLGEVKRALGELPPATHPRHERGQLAAI